MMFRFFSTLNEKISGMNTKIRQCYSLGNYADAEEIAKEALLASEVLEQNDPIYLTCCSNLALIYKTTGKYEEAIFLYKSVHSSYLELYGPSHKSTIILTHNLAYTYKSRGSPDLAISLLQSLPILSPDTLQSYVLKASCYKDLADYATAKQILTDVEAYIHDTYGKGNVVSVNLLNCKGLVHKNCKEFEEAEKCYKEALEIRKEWNGEKHPETLSIRHNLGELYMAWGKKDLAIDTMNLNLKFMQEEVKSK